MRGINYSAGIGVILIFAGIYCFKALFSKKITLNKEGEANRNNLSFKNRVILIISGTLSLLAGIFMIWSALPCNG